MKKGLLILALAIGFSSAYAQYVNTNWVYNRTACTAQTVCPNGKLITCKTVGFNYGNAPAYNNNLCRSRVVPGQFIQCQGFSDQPNVFGGINFVPTNIPISCY